MDDELRKIIEEQFNKLPEVVRNAINSGHIQEKFRVLAQKYQLHVDQWQEVETKIMLTVLGLSPPEQLVDLISRATNLPKERVDEIVSDISTSIFQPIREQLEQELGYPEAHTEKTTDIEKMRQEVLAGAHEKIEADKQAEASRSLSQLLPKPGTPPAPSPSEKVVRAPASGAYKPGETSAARVGIEGAVDDPYREPPK